MKKSFGLTEIMIILAVISLFAAAILPYYFRAKKESDKQNKEPIPITGFGKVKEIYLKDGTRCAVFYGDFKAGISCDWEGDRDEM